MLGPVLLAKLTPKHVVDAYAKIRDASSEKTCVHAHRVLRAAMNYGRKTLRVIKENVVECVPAPKTERKELPPLSEEQVRGIIEAARGTRLEVPILVAALTGLRRGELLALRWKSLDFERGTLTVSESLEQTRRHGVRFKPPKSRSSRRVLPAAEQLLVVLKEYRSKQEFIEPNDLVFSEAGVPWAPDTFSKHFSAIMRRVGITGFRLHDARHAFASLTLKNETSIKEVAALLGHASPTLTLSTYAHVIAGMGREAVNGLARSLLTGPEGSVSKCEQTAFSG
jgi:integrase